MPGLGDLLDSAGEAGRQLFLWGILLQLINDATLPFQRDLQYLVNESIPNVALSPPDLIETVLRGWQTEADASATAKKSGVSQADFDLLVKASGEPPGLETVLLWFRRNIVPFDDVPGKPSVMEAIRTSRIQTSVWADAINKGRLVPIGVADAVDAVIEGQIDFAAGVQIAYENGVDEPDFQILVNTRGNPPPPSDLIELVRRGLIPMKGTGPTATTLEQGIFEGATKDKWEPLYEELATYLPPARTVTALQRAGSIDVATAQKLYSDLGLSPDLAAAYVQNASTDKVAAHKQLQESIILSLYVDQAIDGPTATDFLGLIGYDATEAAYILSVQDLKRTVAAQTTAISKIHTLYVGRKIDATAAQSALGSLGASSQQQTQLIETWTIELDNNVKLLTEAQLVDAWATASISFDEAMAGLQGIGYSAHDSWVLIAIKNKGPTNLPPDPGISPFPSGNIT